MNKNFYSLTILLFMISLNAASAPPPLPDGFMTDHDRYNPYGADAVQYFTDIALGSEFGSNNPHNQVVKKWRSQVRIQLHGSYTKDDEDDLEGMISELKKLTGLAIQRVYRDANINIHFIPADKFGVVIPQYNTITPQIGVFYVESNSITHTIQSATIAIKDSLSGDLREHILREELTQSFGLMRDSYQYNNSVFQQKVESKPTKYAAIDKEIIRILYDPRIQPGMNEEEVKKALMQEGIG